MQFPVIKKMSLLKTKSASAYEVLNFTYPKLHTGKVWYVDFFIFDPVSQTKKRKKYNISPHYRPAERKRIASNLITAICEKLRKGWNPWIDNSTSAQYSLFSKVLANYEKYIERMEKVGTLKASTHARYNSYLKVFIDWVDEKPIPLIYLYQLDTATISDFLDYLIIEKDVSACTRNNYLQWLSTFCTYLVEKGAMSANPTKEIRKLRESQKFREQLSSVQLRMMREFLMKHNRHFLLACMMEYYTFIRPEELSCIKIEDISIKGQRVRLSGKFTKNRKNGMVGLNDEIIKLMIDLDIFSHTSSDYLFGTPDFRPSPKKQSGRIFRNAFKKLRGYLGWPACYQFYSLKDTGIRDLANAEGIVVARDQARHSDISTTNKYLKGSELTVHEETKHFKGYL